MRLPRVPAPAPALVVLLLVATVELVAWSLLVPALQEPDEASHFSYVQSIAESGEVPFGDTGPRGDLGRLSPEVQLAAVDAGLEPLRANVAARPLWTAADEALWRAHAARLGPDAGKGVQPVSAFANPPLAYLYDVVPYKVVGGSVFDRLFALRWANLPWLLLTVVATWVLAGALFPRRPALVVLATALVALQPLLTSVAAGIAPDALLTALFATGLALAVRIVQDGLTLRRAVVLAALCAAAGLTHGRGLPLVLPALAAAGIAWARGRPRARRPLLIGTAVAALAGLVLALRFAERGGPTVGGTRGFLSYVWQFYLPAGPGMNAPPFPGWNVRDVFVDRLYGAFAQLEVVLAPGALKLVAATGLVLVLGAVAAALWHRRAVLGAWPQLAVIAVAVAGLLGLLHAEAYRDLLVDPGDPVITGRYLLPLLPVLGVGVAAVVGALPRRFAGAAGGAVLAGAVLLQLGALGATLTRFYA